MTQKLTYEQLMKKANINVPQVVQNAEPKYQKIDITPKANPGKKTFDELINVSGRAEVINVYSNMKRNINEYNKEIDERNWYESFDYDFKKREYEEYLSSTREELEGLHDIYYNMPLKPTEEEQRKADEAREKAKRINYTLFQMQNDLEKYEQMKKADEWQKTDAEYKVLMEKPDFDVYSKKNSDEWKHKNENDEFRVMTDEEFAIYQYLLNKESKEKAEDFKKHLQEIINYRLGLEIAKEVKENDGRPYKIIHDEHGLPIFKPVIFATDVATNAGLDSAWQGIKQLFNEEALPTSPWQYAAAQVREDLPEGVSRTIFDLGNIVGNLAPSLALAAVTGGFGAPAVIVKGVGAISMGASAAGNNYKSMLDAGYTKEQARTFAVLTGLSEGGLSFLFSGISKLGGKLTGNVISKLTGNIGNAFVRIASELGMRFFAEGSEEYLQDVLSQIFHNIATGENNEIKIFTEEALYSFFLGGITAGLLDGGSVISNNITANKAGKAVITAKKTNELLNNALKLKPSTEAHKLASKIEKGMLKANDYNIGTLMYAYKKANGDVSFMYTPAAELERETLTEVEQVKYKTIEDVFADYDNGTRWAQMIQDSSARKLVRNPANFNLLIEKLGYEKAKLVVEKAALLDKKAAQATTTPEKAKEIYDTKLVELNKQLENEKAILRNLNAEYAQTDATNRRPELLREVKKAKAGVEQIQNDIQKLNNQYTEYLNKVKAVAEKKREEIRLMEEQNQREAKLKNDIQRYNEILEEDTNEFISTDTLNKLENIGIYPEDVKKIKLSRRIAESQQNTLNRLYKQMEADPESLPIDKAIELQDKIDEAESKLDKYRERLIKQQNNLRKRARQAASGETQIVDISQNSNNIVNRGGIDETGYTEQTQRTADKYGTEAENYTGEPEAIPTASSGTMEETRILGRADSRSVGVSDLTRNILNKRGSLNLNLKSSVDNQAAFSNVLAKAVETNYRGPYLTKYSEQDLIKGNVKTFLNDKRNAGVAVWPDGNISSVFKLDNSGLEGVSDDLIITALSNGGNKLDNFDGGLSLIYEDYGFIPVARVAFDPEYKPSNWKPEWGKPDVIFWVHNGDSPETVAENIGTYPAQDTKNIPLFDTYEEAYAYRDKVLEQMRQTSQPTETQTEAGTQPASPVDEKYTQIIRWGTREIYARPEGKGFFGVRMPQINPRVDAYELKINPNNESYYLEHPNGGFVQFENMVNNTVIDGKLVIQQKSFYHIYDMPEFARNKVLQEAKRQVEAADKAGYSVVWLISDTKAVFQLTDFFKNNNVKIIVKYFPE